MQRCLVVETTAEPLKRRGCRIDSERERASEEMQIKCRKIKWNYN